MSTLWESPKLYQSDLIAVEIKSVLWLSRIGESEPQDTMVRLQDNLAAIHALVERLVSPQEPPTTIALQSTPKPMR
jgi:hypothetical protein